MAFLLRRKTIAALVLLGGLGLGARPGNAQTPEAFYATHPLTLVVGLEAGGGYDLYARMLARHIGHHMNGASVIVQNMPGAGSMTATNYIYNIAPKDGSVLGEMQSGVAFEPLYDNKAARFNAAEFSWVGSINAEVSTCQVWHTAKVKTFDDLFKTEMTVGGTGTGADSNLFPQVLNSILGTKLKLVNGYPGTAPILLAIERGELDGICGVYWSSILSLRPQWFANGDMKPLIQIAIEKHPEHQDIPLVTDYAKNPIDKQALELIFASMKFARPFFGPPGIPADRLAYLRQAFDATMKDPEFLADAQKIKLEIGPTTGDQIVQLIQRLYKSPPEVVERAKAVRN
jgi:tripartite-type tricarboxylate transporter receptor subunit TctC